MASPPARKVLVPVANGTEPLEAVITVDVLRRAGADVTVASVENHLRVDAAHQIKIVADSLISDCADTVFDLIALPDSSLLHQKTSRETEGNPFTERATKDSFKTKD